MKILLCTRQDCYKNFAGDTTLVLKTAQYLKKIGVEVYVNNGCIYDFSEYDVIHLFNLNKVGETYKYYKMARQHKKKILLSPEYFNLSKYYKHMNYTEKLKWWERSNVYRKEILKGAAKIIVNSKIEQENIKKDFRIQKLSSVIYKGVEVEDEEVPLYNFRERYKLNTYVLCVGNICPKKNQLTLANVCSELGVQLVLIGKVTDKEYFKQCIKFDNVLYLGFMDSYNIYNAYRFAKVHILPSYVEIPGLSSLEAAASGCNIISTVEGTAKEYLKDMAVYCNPYDDNSIYEEVERGLAIRKNNKLKNYVNENYTWEKYSKELYKNYNELIISL
ncbi:glycosyltransferase family 4 protein [Clostridium sp. ZS2-4]|uniref:glycosyltransferase family 4 protein n=1 Tax=Clostridium sp. ZS2-4 TaxID=2987703 RepID=UPI00227B4C40|nr:glycosyltransferase [Clostridium sp. ZS2-4]MCY6353852.1 glycosyltransferase [Clostridium sp. ZS2-4]